MRIVKPNGHNLLGTIRYLIFLNWLILHRAKKSCYYYDPNSMIFLPIAVGKLYLFSHDGYLNSHRISGAGMRCCTLTSQFEAPLTFCKVEVVRNTISLISAFSTLNDDNDVSCWFICFWCRDSYVPLCLSLSPVNPKNLEKISQNGVYYVPSPRES